MTDEIVPSADASGVADPAATDAAPVAPEATPDPEPKPHPLHPGGERFEQVYGKWKTSEGRIAELERQLAEERSAKEAAAAKAAAPAAPTVEQIQAALDAGQITAAQAVSIGMYHAKEAAKAEALSEFDARQRQREVLTEVETYTTRVPALRDPASEEYGKVYAAAQALARDLGKPVSDPVVKRLAMREVFGPPDRLGAKARVAEQDRVRSDPGGVLTGSNGGGAPAPAKDPLKAIPQAQIQFWQRLGYTREQMLAEAPFVNVDRFARRGTR